MLKQFHPFSKKVTSKPQQVFYRFTDHQ